MESAGATIVDLYNQIYNLGDDAVDDMYHRSPVFRKYWDRYEGDIDSLVAEVDPAILAKIEREIRAAAAGEPRACARHHRPQAFERAA